MHNFRSRLNAQQVITHAPFIALVIAMLATMIAFDRPLIRGDGVAYLAWIDTLILDQDVNFDNQYERLQGVNTYQIEWSVERERWVNIFPFGIAFVQAPFYLMGDAFLHAGVLNINPDYFRQHQGVEAPYSFWLMIGANVMALIAAILAWRIGRRLIDRWTAAIIAYAAFLGTPLFFYSTVSPVNSHNPAAFTTAAFIYLLVILTGAFEAGTDTDSNEENSVADDHNRHTIGWILFGVFAGLTILTRWQLGLVVAPGYALLVYERRWRGLIIASVAAGITLLPLPIVWNAMFGKPFLVPYDAVNNEPFMRPSNHSLEVLWQTVLHSPVVLLSLAGIVAMWRNYRKWAMVCGVIIALQVVINGAALDWDAGDSYGMRRMSEIYIVYVILACGALDWLVQWGREHGWRFTRRLIRIALAILMLYTFLYIFAFLDYLWTNPYGLFKDRPDVMISYLLNQDLNWRIVWEVYKTHVGPLAWSMPGP
jgi:hypothetical protein